MWLTCFHGEIISKCFKRFLLFFFKALGRYYCWWTIRHRSSHQISSKYLSDGIIYNIPFLNCLFANFQIKKNIRLQYPQSKLTLNRFGIFVTEKILNSLSRRHNYLDYRKQPTKISSNEKKIWSVPRLTRLFNIHLIS